MMIKLVYCFRKRRDLSDEAFWEYWHNAHTALGIAMPGVRRLVQSRTRRHPSDPVAPDYDGMAELWFDDWAALAVAAASPEWAASTEDEANFIEPGSAAYFVTEEHVVLGQPTRSSA
jgi:uncharacterized protein (TIGR02118 family)